VLITKILAALPFRTLEDITRVTVIYYIVFHYSTYLLIEKNEKIVNTKIIVNYVLRFFVKSAYKLLLPHIICIRSSSV